MNSRARLLAGDQVELAVAVARLDVAQPVVLVRRRAQRLGEHARSRRRAATARRARMRSAAPSTPTRSPRSSDVSRSKRLLAEHVARARAAGSCRCGRRGRGTPRRPEPRRAARRPATRWRSLGLLAAARGARRPRSTRRSARRPRRRAGTASASAARSALALRAALGDQLGAGRARPASPGRRRPAAAPLIAASLLQADVDLGDLQLARGAARHLHGDRLVALAPDQRAADRRLVGELVLVAAWPRPSRRSCT